MRPGFKATVSVFEKEAAWLLKVIHQRINASLKRNRNFASADGNAGAEMPDHKEEETNYGSFIHVQQLDLEERLLLALVLVPYLKPHFLKDAFCERNMSNDIVNNFAEQYPETGLSRGQNFDGLVPTGLTFLFLVAGRDLEQRLNAASIFNAGSKLIKEKVIHLESTVAADPAYSGRLILSKAYYELFLGQKKT